MSRTITIDPVTRIEGHSKITIQLDDAGRVSSARFHVTQFRGFEKLVEGRPFHEMPSLTARVCGICPVSHLIASAKACDALLAVEIPETAAKLRQVLNLAQILQSHALSFFHLSSPDLVLGMDAHPDQRNLFGVVGQNPELARDGIWLRQYGQEIIALLGGKRIHPAWVVPGGVSAPLTADRRDEILRRVPEAMTRIQRTLDWYKQIFGDFGAEIRTFGNFPSLFMGTVTKNGELEMYDGNLRIVDATGRIVADQIDPRTYSEWMGEAVEPDSYLKSPYYKPLGYPDGIYRVGPLARLNLIDRVGTPRADEEWAEFRMLERGATLSSFQYHYPPDRDALLRREDQPVAQRAGHPQRPRPRQGRSQPAGRYRRQRSAARHAAPPLQDRPQGIDGLGQHDHRHRQQQPGDEQERLPGGAALRPRRQDRAGHAQPRRSGHPHL